jgi:hypothetical protein
MIAVAFAKYLLWKGAVIGKKRLTNRTFLSVYGILV